VSSALTSRLEALLSRLEEIWQPFAHPTMDWNNPQGLVALIDARDLSLEAAAPVLEEVREEWKRWEEDGPDDKERARVFSVRNRLVNLALEASRFEQALEASLRRGIDEGRRQAATATTKLRAATAYGRHVLRR